MTSRCSTRGHGRRDSIRSCRVRVCDVAEDAKDSCRSCSPHPPRLELTKYALSEQTARHHLCSLPAAPSATSAQSYREALGPKKVVDKDRAKPRLREKRPCQVKVVVEKRCAHLSNTATRQAKSSARSKKKRERETKITGKSESMALLQRRRLPPSSTVFSYEPPAKFVANCLLRCNRMVQ